MSNYKGNYPISQMKITMETNLHQFPLYGNHNQVHLNIDQTKIHSPLSPHHHLISKMQTKNQKLKAKRTFFCKHYSTNVLQKKIVFLIHPRRHHQLLSPILHHHRRHLCHCPHHGQHHIQCPLLRWYTRGRVKMKIFTMLLALVCVLAM